MRLFGGIKDTYKKSEAAVVVQNLLEMQAKAGIFDGDPASSATDLVGIVWTKSPHLFDGRFGQRPHKISVAAASFANAISVLGHENSNGRIFSICLGNLLNEIAVNGNLYPLNNLDAELIQSAATEMERFSADFASSSLGQEVEELMRGLD